MVLFLNPGCILMPAGLLLYMVIGEFNKINMRVLDLKHKLDF